MLRLVCHGGMCCGIKTIYGFDNPDDKQAAVSKKVAISNDRCGEHVDSDLDFFTDEAPEETCKERLDRLIKFCMASRPDGIIEATLMKAVNCLTGKEVFFSQYYKWAPLLRKRGFRLSVKSYNSNSSHTVYVFHKKYGSNPSA